MRKSATYTVSELLPTMAGHFSGKTLAPHPVWRDSTTQEARYAPLSKKQAARILHKARRWDRRTRGFGTHGGIIGRTALSVLNALLFDLPDLHRTGKLDPSYDTIGKWAGVCRRAVASALQRLKTLGILNWLRRCTAERDQLGRITLKQDTNAYAVIPPSQWRGYVDVAQPDLHPSEWGAVPPMPPVIAQAVMARNDGDSMRSVVRQLKSDPGDALAAAIASLGIALGVA